MSKCEVCRKDLILPYKCSGCKKFFCKRHLQGKEHNCGNPRQVRPIPDRGNSTLFSANPLPDKTDPKKIKKEKKKKVSGPSLHHEDLKSMTLFGDSWRFSVIPEPRIPTFHQSTRERPVRPDLIFLSQDAEGHSKEVLIILKNQDKDKIIGVEIKIDSLDAVRNGTSQRELVRKQLLKYIQAGCLTHLILVVPKIFGRKYFTFLISDRELTAVGLYTIEAGQIEIIKEPEKLPMKYYAYTVYSVQKNRMHPLGGLSYTQQLFEVGTNRPLPAYIDSAYVFPQPYFYIPPIYNPRVYNNFWGRTYGKRGEDRREDSPPLPSILSK